jgi:hypothetical protein
MERNDPALHPCASEQLEAIKQLLAKEQERDRLYHATETVSELVNRVVDEKKLTVVRVMQQAKEFQSDVLSFLRAFSLMLETVAGAATHGEKAARLRGLMELVETAAERVRDARIRDCETWSYRMAEDVFRSDYPVRHYIEKAREEKARADAAEAKLRGEGNADAE